MRKSQLALFMLFTISFSIVHTDAVCDSVEKKWDEILKREAFIYTVPRVQKPTPIDGTYVKNALRKGEIVPCRRCPDWLPNPGIWRINFDKGVFRIINTGTGWKSIGTYIVAGDRILFSNDPGCIYDFGLYAFKLAKGKLSFSLIDDPCAVKLRGLNLTETEWISCCPPNEEAAVTEHWPKPEGCR